MEIEREEVLTVKVNPKFKEKVKKLADMRHVSMSDIVRMTLQDKINDMEQAKDFGDNK